jgi:hypothetical protein
MTAIKAAMNAVPNAPKEAPKAADRPPPGPLGWGGAGPPGEVGVLDPPLGVLAPPLGGPDPDE